MSGFECRILPKVRFSNFYLIVLFLHVNKDLTTFSAVQSMMNLPIEMEYGIYKMKLPKKELLNRF